MWRILHQVHWLSTTVTKELSREDVSLGCVSPGLTGSTRRKVMAENSRDRGPRDTLKKKTPASDRLPSTKPHILQFPELSKIVLSSEDEAI